MKKYIIILIIGLFLFSGLYACPIYSFTGIPCPSCGITRAYTLLFTGHIKDAFIMHPLFWLPAIYIFKPVRKTKYIVTGIIVFLAVYLLRMVLMFPDTPPLNYNYNSIIGEFLR